MATIASRGGEVHIRVGGNTQDYATLVDSLDNGNVIQKLNAVANNPTSTPTLSFTRDLLYMMSNISHFVLVEWCLGQRIFLPPGVSSLILARCRCSPQRYNKLAIANRHRGREDPWR